MVQLLVPGLGSDGVEVLAVAERKGGVPVSSDPSDEEVEQRYAIQHKTLRQHWRQRGWEPSQPDGFYVSWSSLFQYAWRLLVCNVAGHKWHDVHFILYGEPGEDRTCKRCWRDEALEGAE